MKALSASLPLHGLLPLSAALGLLILLTVSAAAQKNELALTLGGYFPRHVHAQSDNVFAIEGNVAHRLLQFPAASLFVEVPIAAGSNSGVKATAILGGQSFSTRSYSSLFISPGLKLKIIPESPLSPYLALGGGLAHFSKSGSSSTDTGVLDFGGGLDWKIAPFASLRGELRDFYSGAPQLINGLSDREHQFVATGGIVFRF